MRLLIACTYEPLNEMHGQGVIIKNTLVAAGNLGSRLSIGLSLFRDGARGKARECEIEGIPIKMEYSQPAATLSKTSLARTLFHLPLSEEENNFLRKTAAIAVQYDAVLWFGSPYDPVTHHISRAVRSPVVYHATDSVTLHEERRAGRGSRLRKTVATYIEKRMLREGGFASVIYVGAADAARAQLLHGKNEGQKIVHLPNGVDVGRFYPRAKKSLQSPTILFAGSMCYAPNIQAASRLVREILPLLKTRPVIRIVGHSPSQGVLELADLKAGRVVVTGRVDDISAEYGNADLLVAPIKMGAGMQNKVLEALASGIPVVTSPLVAEGMGGQFPGMFICQTVADYAVSIDQLLLSDQQRQISGTAGRAHIEANFTWEKRARRLWDLLRQASDQKPLSVKQ